MFPRQNPKACHPYASKIKSYCDHGDPFCDGGPDLGTHGGYFGKYNNEATNFVYRKVLGL